MYYLHTYFQFCIISYVIRLVQVIQLLCIIYQNFSFIIIFLLPAVQTNEDMTDIAYKEGKRSGAFIYSYTRKYGRMLSQLD